MVVQVDAEAPPRGERMSPDRCGVGDLGGHRLHLAVQAAGERGQRAHILPLLWAEPDVDAVVVARAARDPVDQARLVEERGPVAYTHTGRGTGIPHTGDPQGPRTAKAEPCRAK